MRRQDIPDKRLRKAKDPSLKIFAVVDAPHGSDGAEDSAKWAYLSNRRKTHALLISAHGKSTKTGDLCRAIVPGIETQEQKKKKKNGRRLYTVAEAGVGKINYDGALL